MGDKKIKKKQKSYSNKVKRALIEQINFEEKNKFKFKLVHRLQQIAAELDNMQVNKKKVNVCVCEGFVHFSLLFKSFNAFAERKKERN